MSVVSSSSGASAPAVGIPPATDPVDLRIQELSSKLFQFGNFFLAAAIPLATSLGAAALFATPWIVITPLVTGMIPSLVIAIRYEVIASNQVFDLNAPGTPREKALAVVEGILNTIGVVTNMFLSAAVALVFLFSWTFLSGVWLTVALGTTTALTLYGITEGIKCLAKNLANIKSTHEHFTQACQLIETQGRPQQSPSFLEDLYNLYKAYAVDSTETKKEFFQKLQQLGEEKKKFFPYLSPLLKNHPPEYLLADNSDWVYLCETLPKEKIDAYLQVQQFDEIKERTYDAASGALLPIQVIADASTLSHILLRLVALPAVGQEPAPDHPQYQAIVDLQIYKAAVMTQEQKLFEQFPGVAQAPAARELRSSAYTLEQARVHHQALLAYLDQCGNKGGAALSKLEQNSQQNAVRLIEKLQQRFPEILTGVSS